MSSLNANSSAVSVTTQGKYNVTPPTYADGASTEVQTDVNGNQQQVGNVAHDAADAGNPIKIGGKALNAAPADVTNNDRVNAYFDLKGRLVVLIDNASTAIVNGNVANNAADSGNPIKVGGVYNNAPITLDNGDRGDLQLDVNGYLKVADTVLAALDKGTGGVSGATLRVKLSNEDVAYIDGIEAALTSIDGGIPAALGQTTKANSMPVTIASDQDDLPIRLKDGSGSAINKGQAAMAGSIPVVLASDQSNINVVLASAIPAGTNNIGDVDVLTLPSIPAGTNNIGDVDVLTLPAIPAGSNTIGKVDINTLSVIDQIDNAVGPVLNAASNTIQDNAGTFLQVVASLAAQCKKIRVADTTGKFIGVYTGAVASETLSFIINPGQSNEIEHTIAAGTRITLRNMATDDIVEGELCMQFLG